MCESGNYCCHRCLLTIVAHQNWWCMLPLFCFASQLPLLLPWPNEPVVCAWLFLLFSYVAKHVAQCDSLLSACWLADWCCWCCALSVSFGCCCFWRLVALQHFHARFGVFRNIKRTKMEKDKRIKQQQQQHHRTDHRLACQVFHGEDFVMPRSSDSDLNGCCRRYCYCLLFLCNLLQ